MAIPIDTIAWLVLRIVYAALFLYPIKGLVQDWPTTQSLVKLVWPYDVALNIICIAMIMVMFAGALSIALGLWAQVGGMALLIYCLFGAKVHYALAGALQANSLSENAIEADKTVFSQAVNLGVVGHVTSAQKNFVLSSVAFYFVILGSGPLSITSNLF